MRKILNLVFNMLLVLLMVVILNNNVSAKAVKKTGHYFGGTSKSHSQHLNNRITSTKYKANKLTVKGGLYYSYTDEEGLSHNPGTIRGKMTFKVSDKCKFYKNNKKVSKKTMKKKYFPLKKNWDLSIQVKKEKIVKMYVYSYTTD